MDWQTPEDAVPSAFVTESNRLAISAKPPASGAWRVGDDPGDRSFVSIGTLDLERGSSLPAVTIAYETWGELNAAGDNAVLVLHALTGDSHLVGPAGPGHPTAGWWSGVVGAGKTLDPARWFIVAPNMLGGCQGSTGPATVAPDGAEWGSRFPYLTIRDQVAAQRAVMTELGIRSWALVVGGSMGGMQVLEWGDQPSGSGRSDRGARRPARHQRRPDRAQLGAARGDPDGPRLRRPATTTTPRTARVRTAASPSPAGWRCSPTAPPSSSTTGSAAAGRAA